MKEFFIRQSFFQDIVRENIVNITIQFQPASELPSGSLPRRYYSAGWVAVKELKLSYYIGETLLFTIYTHYGNLI